MEDSTCQVGVQPRGVNRVNAELPRSRAPVGRRAEKPGQPLECQFSRDSPERDPRGRER